MPVDLDEFALAKLAREMAMNIRNYKTVFEDFGITEEDYYEIEKIEFYKRAKEQFTLEWNSVLSVADRVKLKSAVLSEEVLHTFGKRMLRETTPTEDVVNGLKLLCKNAGIGEGKEGTANAERFVITINMGADTEHYDKSITIDAKDISPEPKIVGDAKVKSRLLDIGKK